MEQKRGEGGGETDFNRGVQAGSRDRCLKKGDWNPLMNYGLTTTMCNRDKSFAYNS